MKEKMKAVLVLEDGSVWHGEGFGAEAKVEGEVVFNTGMVGYTEGITDPSYRGQILCQTYPLIGNYGVNPEDFESDRPQITAYIVSELCAAPSHYTSRKGLDQWLAENRIPGMAGIDTRELTKRLRTKGVMLGILQTCKGEIDEEVLAEEVKAVKDPNKRDLVGEVTVSRPVVYGSGSRWKIAAIDCGIKMNIIRCLTNRGFDVVRVPAHVSADKIMGYNPNGVLVSNGPGDPKKAAGVVETIRKLTEYKIPQMGICLGNQLVALALGADTYKLKFGHRGQNHPVLDIKTGRCFITSQNHGYAVDYTSAKDKGMDVTFLHANDRSVEAMSDKRFNIAGYQWHPEHSPGPRDTEILFDRFLEGCRG
jgi:carbamoyl-phosphate synthase small subunit